MAALRAGALRSLASELGHALRVARLRLDEGDVARFLSPLADVLDDVGGTLRGYLSQGHSLAVGCAPAHVAQEISLLHALASTSTSGSTCCFVPVFELCW